MRVSSVFVLGFVAISLLFQVSEVVAEERPEPHIRRYSVDFLEADREPVNGELWARISHGDDMGRVQVNTLEVPYEARHMSGLSAPIELWITVADGWSPTFRPFATEDRSFFRIPILPTREVRGRLPIPSVPGQESTTSGSFVLARFRQASDAVLEDDWASVGESNLRCPVDEAGTFVCQLPAAALDVIFQRNLEYEANAAELEPDRVRAERLGIFEEARALRVRADVPGLIDLGAVELSPGPPATGLE